MGRALGGVQARVRTHVPLNKSVDALCCLLCSLPYIAMCNSFLVFQSPRSLVVPPPIIPSIHILKISSSPMLSCT